jgi:hypothetical protein
MTEQKSTNLWPNDPQLIHGLLDFLGVTECK